MIISNKELRIKLEELEKKTDKKFSVVFKAIANLIGNPQKDTASRKIGFKIILIKKQTATAFCLFYFPELSTNTLLTILIL